MRLIASTLHAVTDSERCVRRRPIKASRQLQDASGRLMVASARLQRAARQLGAMNQCIRREPESAQDAPLFLVEATEYCAYLNEWLGEVADKVLTFHEDVLNGLETGTLVPEPPPGRRPRIILAPRPAPVRAFLAARRQPRAADRIAAILSRRRRTPRPAAVRVPRRNPTGRAPPVFSTCLL